MVIVERAVVKIQSGVLMPLSNEEKINLYVFSFINKKLLL